MATSARVAMLAAGFYLARGLATGPKHETTIALTPAALRRAGAPPRELFGPEWLEKWERSGAKYPAEISSDERAAFAESIRTHPQFRRD